MLYINLIYFAYQGLTSSLQSDDDSLVFNEYKLIKSWQPNWPQKKEVFASTLTGCLADPENLQNPEKPWNHLGGPNNPEIYKLT